MPAHQDLNSLFNLKASPSAATVIIYSERITPRLSYVCGFIFNQALQVNFEITRSRQQWHNSEHYKISYSEENVTEGLRIIPQQLLFETGISEKKPEATVSNGALYFYNNAGTEANAFPFDVFAAVFYFISRYEEWQPFVRDAHGRFEAAASLLHVHKAHLSPAVDAWICTLKAALQNKYPNLIFPLQSFRAVSTIDVDNLFAYAHKGLVRTAGALVKDVLKGDLKNLAARLRVIAGLEKDPFDVYEDLCQFSQQQDLPLLFFFLFRSGTTYDRTVDPRSPVFEKVFSILKKNRVPAGLHPSYNSAYTSGMMEKEVRRFSKKWGAPVKLSRQHFLRFEISTTPHLLMQQGIEADFTMGFASEPGFRAGTSRPFYYYDFKAEKQEALLFVPFCAMDGAYLVYDQVNAETAFQSLWNLALEVKKVDGFFVTIYHERTFYNHLYNGFGTLYKNLYLKLKEL